MHRLLGLSGAAILVAGALSGCGDDVETSTETGTTTGGGTSAGTETGTTTGGGTETGTTTGTATGGGTSTAMGGGGGGTPTGAGGGVPGPVAYWTLDTADISGTTVVDTIGDADGTNDGAVPDPSGQVGQALSFDGTNDFINFGDVLENVIAGADAQFSVSMWIKPSTVLTGHFLLAKLGDTACVPDDSNRQWSMQVASTPRFTFFGSLNQPLVARSGTGTAMPSTVGQWYHLVFVYDGTVDTGGVDRLGVYVDGVADTLTETISMGAFPFDLPADGAAPLAFGIRVDSSGNPCSQGGSTFFAGSLDELAIFDSALGQAEVDAIRARGVAGQSL